MPGGSEELAATLPDGTRVKLWLCAASAKAQAGPALQLTIRPQVRCLMWSSTTATVL
jgi:hypothetical protein